MLEYYCSDYIALDELQAASDNAKEASEVKGIEIIPVKTVAEVIKIFLK